jgi:hypothetical protein
VCEQSGGDESRRRDRGGRRDSDCNPLKTLLQTLLKSALPTLRTNCRMSALRVFDARIAFASAEVRATYNAAT